MFGSIDANRDPQNGWITDQFPNSVEELSLGAVRDPVAQRLEAGGFNFDAKLRRGSGRPRLPDEGAARAAGLLAASSPPPSDP